MIKNKQKMKCKFKNKIFRLRKSKELKMINLSFNTKYLFKATYHS